MASAITKISIINRALQILGNQSISSLTENSRGAKAMLRAYDSIFLAELEAHTWNFAIKRAELAADATPPIFGKARYFPLPADYLYLAPEETTLGNPSRRDYQIEGHSIVSDLDSPLPIRYVSLDVQESDFSPTFAEAFASALAMACCEEITNSNAKMQGIAAVYDMAIKRARRKNDFQNAPVKSPTCTFISVRD
jgi:hypothetical protein